MPDDQNIQRVHAAQHYPEAVTIILVRAAVSVYTKMITAGSMLSADIFSQKEREEGLVEAYLNIHSLLEANCMQFCPNYK